ncbi:hypothetical protein SOV_24950 [Sporomusa ovata DSM 2662]|nr:hypothetical protein [Sporomusa ovata]EQB25807.1 hypothetical protein SOV_4c04740 [Sporomusa ovata DSM 2662]
MIIYVIFGMLAAFLLGYILGKHHGWEKGYQEAAATLPLELRRQSLEEGKCIICAECQAKTSNHENFSTDLNTL